MVNKIVIAEDEFIIALDLKNILKDYEIILAKSAEELVALSCRFKPNLVITDINLKISIDGVTAAALIQEFIKIPIIFISAYADNFEDRLQHITKYVFIPKPINSEYLTNQVKLLLNTDAVKN